MCHLRPKPPRAPCSVVSELQTLNKKITIRPSMTYINITLHVLLKIVWLNRLRDLWWDCSVCWREHNRKILSLILFEQPLYELCQESISLIARTLNMHWNFRVMFRAAHTLWNTYIFKKALAALRCRLSYGCITILHSRRLNLLKVWVLHHASTPLLLSCNPSVLQLSH